MAGQRGITSYERRNHQRRSLGIRKAAILVASLEPAAADALLAQLGPEQAQRVREAAASLDDIDADQRRRVIDEFLRIGPMTPYKEPPGIELDGQLPRELTLPRSVPPIEEPAKPDNDTPFCFLHEAEEEKLSQLLTGERPQTIALVLSHLPPERAGDVLAHFPASLQVEVVRRLVDLEDTDPEVLREVEQALESRLSRQFAVAAPPRRRPGSRRRNPRRLRRRHQRAILENLVAHDRDLAEQLGRRPHGLRRPYLARRRHAVGRVRGRRAGVAQTALIGASPLLVERLARVCPPRGEGPAAES